MSTPAERACRAAHIAFSALAIAAAVACQRVTPPPSAGNAADILIVNGVVFPADGTNALHEALAIRGSTIALVGTNAQARTLEGARTEVIDAHGGTVVPGFNDPHFHAFLDLESGPLHLNETTLKGTQRRIAEYAAAHRDGWIVGQGWLYSAFPHALPTREQLDAIVGDRPAFIRSYDYHTAWANSAALKLAGITRETPNPKAGIIDKDPVTGEPTGVLKENAQGLVAPLLPKPTLEERKAALIALIGRLHRAGITSVQTADSDPAHFDAYNAVRLEGGLHLRMSAAISPGPLFDRGSSGPIDDRTVDGFDRLRLLYTPDTFFDIDAIKLLADGVVEANTAALLAPYANNASTTGMLAYSQDELTRIATLLDRRGWTMMIHAIGDAAVRATLNAYEAAAAVNPAPTRPRRHRVEHMETMDPADMPRFGQLGVIASFHPSGWDGRPLPRAILGVWAAALGPARVARYGAWVPVANSGGLVLVGSDYPAAAFDPIPRLYAVASPAANPEHPEAQLSMAAAIEAYTRGPAYAEFREDIKGSLAPGKLADVVVLSQNLLTQPLPDVKTVAVDVTILNGVVEYRRGVGRW
jgi:predicted amidohydrolase YtcJ